VYKIALSRTLVTWGTGILVCSLSSCGSDGGSEPPAPVATVTVAPASATIAPEATLQLEATARDAGGAALSGRDITWSSSDNSIATVSSDGLVTGVAAGSATITAASEGKNGTATIEVEVPVGTVVVTPVEAAIAVSETVQLSAATLDPDGNELTDRAVAWSSSDPAIASVSGTGLVTGVAAGTATITATSEDQSGSASISVGAANVAGHWSMDMGVSDEAVGFSCDNFPELTFNQTGSTFTGTNVQNGTCTFGEGDIDNSGTFDITDGQVVGLTITFTQPDPVPCVFEGTVEPGVIMSGTVSCQGTFHDTAVHATGTWCATFSGSLRAAAWSPRRAIRIGRALSCG